MQVLTTWVSALCPQNMLEQLLIHQPKDPILFMINHLQLDNDNGEHSASPLLPLLFLGARVNSSVLPVSKGWSEQGMEGFRQLGVVGN